MASYAAPRKTPANAIEFFSPVKYRVTRASGSNPVVTPPIVDFTWPAYREDYNGR